jgi:hypothetical protein
MIHPPRRRREMRLQRDVLGVGKVGRVDGWGHARTRRTSLAEASPDRL